jgi:hypothetical protein
MPTISRRLASAGTADPGDLKSPSLPGASPGSPTSFVSGPLRFGRPACGSQGIADRFGSNPNSLGSASLPTPTSLRSAELRPGRPIWNVNRTSGPGLGANECVPLGMWCKSTAFRHSCARSSKRAVRLISGVALDECRVPERYRTRAPRLRPAGYGLAGQPLPVGIATSHHFESLNAKQIERPGFSVVRKLLKARVRAGGRDRPGV